MRAVRCAVLMIKTTHTTLDVLQESRIDDYWNIDVIRDLSDSWSWIPAVHNVENFLKDICGPKDGC